MFEKITPSTESLAHKIDYLEKGILQSGLKMDDIYSLNLLQPLLNGYPFLPFTGSSLRPFCLLHMLNDIIVNNRKSIIEFGSGLSTIMMARLIKKNSLDAMILSVEHNKEWVNVLSGILTNEKLDTIVQLLYIPLGKCDLATGDNLWYEQEKLNQEIRGRKFDMVIVDGPPAWEKGKEKARYPALPFIIGKLNDRFSVYLDDANRPGEQSILQLWKKEYAIDFVITGRTLGYHSGRESFYTEPMSYY